MAHATGVRLHNLTLRNAQTGIQLEEAGLAGSILVPGDEIVLERLVVYSLSGPALSGRELLAQRFFFTGMAPDESGTYLTTKQFAEDIVSQMAQKGMDLAKCEGRYMFVDSYAPQSDPSLLDTPTVKYVPSVADFAKLSNAIITTLGDFMGKGVSRQRLVFDSVDTVLMYVSPAGVYRFLSYLRAKLRGLKAVSMLLLQPDLHDEKDVRTMLQLADVLMELDPASGLLTITQPAEPKLAFRYKITDKGIEISKP